MPFASIPEAIEELKNGKMIIGNLSGPGSSSYGVNLVQEGSPLGQIYGPVFNGIDPNGAATIKDLDGNGIGCVCEGDLKVLGNALPKFNFGWATNFPINVSIYRFCSEEQWGIKR